MSKELARTATESHRPANREEFTMTRTISISRVAVTATLALLLAGVIFLALRVGGTGTTEALAAPKPKPRPNVVVIMTDDQNLESVRVMPNVQRLLAAQGTTFANNFASFSLCCPSRATFLTGQYAHNHGVMGNSPPEGGYAKLDHRNTVAVWLQRAGYYTAHIGKFLNGYGSRNSTPTEVPPGWTNWQGSVDPTTYRFYDYTLNENGKLVTYGSDPASYQADVYTRKAVEVIRQQVRKAKPVFLSLAYLAPHSGGPRTPQDPPNQATPEPAPRHQNRFSSEQLPADPSFNEQDVSDKPLVIRQRRMIGAAQAAGIRENYQQRLESLLAIDEGVGAIVNALRAARELENTLIIFTTDNGFFHGEHRVPSGKVLVYEPSIRIPLIVRGPGFARGKRVTDLTANIDWAPTIVAASRIKAGRVLDGISLQRFGKKATTNVKRDILLEAGAGPANGPNRYTAIRTHRYVYAEYANGDRELYDLQTDPYQLQSRHNDAALSTIRDDLARRLAQLRTCAGSRCRASGS